MIIEKDIKIIPSGTYQGYVWMSDKAEPEVYNDEVIEDIMLDERENPFIIEAQMYKVDNCVSYSVKYVDGEYVAIKYSELIDEELGMNRPIVYFGNRIGCNLKFRQYWKAEDDQMCERMKVLKPGNLVFVGFERKEETK